MTNIKIPLLISLIALLLAVVVQGRDWPQWRGPFLNGSTDEKNLPGTWDKTENIVWVRSLPGPGSGTPIIRNGRVFIASADRQTQDLLAMCFDENSGRELWRRKLGTSARRWPRNEMASPSPVADEKLVCFTFGSGDRAGRDLEGNVLWKRNIEKEYGNLALQFGYSASPLLYKETLYVPVLRRDKPYRPPRSDLPLDSFLLAVEAKTGKILWKQPRQTDAYDESMESYITPIIFDNHGRHEILLTGCDYVTSHNPETGGELWRFEYITTRHRDQRVIPSLVTGDGLIFGSRNKHGGVFAIKTLREGKDTKVDYAWNFTGPSPDCGTPLYYDGLLYVLDGIRSGKTLSCLDPKTAKVLWQGKIGGNAPWRASLTGADGKLYCINEVSEAIVLTAGRQEFRILFRYDFKEKPSRSSIAVANGRLFIRTAKNLYCIGKSQNIMFK